MSEEMMPETTNAQGTAAAMDTDAKSIATLVYLLQALGYVLGVTFIAAVVVNYVKRDEVKGTWLESHFRWQIRTFWFSVLWGVIGVVTAVLVVGYFILLASAIWGIYRIVKGWLRLNDGLEMYTTA